MAGPADVHPRIVAAGGDSPVKVLLRLLNEGTELRPLRLGEVEEGGKVLIRDQQQMTRGDPVKIRSRIPARGTKEDLLILRGHRMDRILVAYSFQERSY